MRVKLTHLASLLAAGAAALAITAAPIASAASTTPQQSCTQTVSGSECETPGNVEINDIPAPMNYAPYGDDGVLIGGFGGDGGFHGGGFHGGGGHR
jgi:hypothetical protein